MGTQAEKLTRLAQKEFPDLTAPEFEVLRAAAVGEWADLLQWGTPPPKPKKYNPGGGSLRSALVTWLCTDARAKKLVHREGLCIKNATLDAILNLTCSEVTFYFCLENCRLPGLHAPAARFFSNLNLKLSRVDGQIDLKSAKIAGQLQLQGVRLLAKGHDAFRIHDKNDIPAFDGDSLKIGGHIHLSNSFLALGLVNLNGAHIDGALMCDDGQFINTGSFALAVQSATIANGIFLSGRFLAKGEVNFHGVSISGRLDCRKGRFINKEGTAICLEHANIAQAVMLEPKAVSGDVSLFRASIGHGLRMKQTSGLAKCSKLDLRGAKIGLLTDSVLNWPVIGRLLLDGFHYDSIDHNAPMTAEERLDWLGRQPQNQFLPQPYEELAAFFQRAGHDSEAKDVRIEKENAHQRHFKNPIKKAWWFLKWATIGYGYRPQRALYWLLGLILLGSTVFTLKIDDMTPSVSYHYNATDSSDVKGDFIASNYPDLNTLFYSIDVALPIVDLQQERYWMPNSDTNAGCWLWWFNWFEVLAGWFLASMGIAGATGIIRKD